MPGHGVIPIRTQVGNPYRPCPAMPRRFDEERRNKYARSAKAWLVSLFRFFRPVLFTTIRPP